MCTAVSRSHPTVRSVGACYLVREHGTGPTIKVGSRHQVNCGERSVVVTYGVIRTVAYRDAWSKRYVKRPTGCYIVQRHRAQHSVQHRDTKSKTMARAQYTTVEQEKIILLGNKCQNYD